MNMYVLSFCLRTQFSLFPSCMKTCQMPVDTQMSVSKLMQCLPSLILYSLTVCAQCTIPQHEGVCCYCYSICVRVQCACISIKVLQWCYGTALWLDVALHYMGWGWAPGRLYGALFLFVSYLMHLLTPPKLSADLGRHSTPPSVCQTKVHLPNPPHLFRRFNILLYLWLNSIRLISQNVFEDFWIWSCTLLEKKELLPSSAAYTFSTSLICH